MEKLNFVKTVKRFKYKDFIAMLCLQNKIFRVLDRQYKCCQKLLPCKNTFCLLEELQVVGQQDWLYLLK